MEAAAAALERVAAVLDVGWVAAEANWEATAGAEELVGRAEVTGVEVPGAEETVGMQVALAERVETGEAGGATRGVGTAAGMAAAGTAAVWVAAMGAVEMAQAGMDWVVARRVVKVVEEMAVAATVEVD